MITNKNVWNLKLEQLNVSITKKIKLHHSMIKTQIQQTISGCRKKPVQKFQYKTH